VLHPLKKQKNVPENIKMFHMTVINTSTLGTYTCTDLTHPSHPSTPAESVRGKGNGNGHRQRTRVDDIGGDEYQVEHKRNHAHNHRKVKP